MLLCSWGGLSARASIPKIQPSSLHWWRCQWLQLQLTLGCHRGCPALKQLLLPGWGWMGEACSAIDFPPVQGWRGIPWIKTVR